MTNSKSVFKAIHRLIDAFGQASFSDIVQYIDNLPNNKRLRKPTSQIVCEAISLNKKYLTLNSGLITGFRSIDYTRKITLGFENETMFVKFDPNAVVPKYFPTASIAKIYDNNGTGSTVWLNISQAQLIAEGFWWEPYQDAEYNWK